MVYIRARALNNQPVAKQSHNPVRQSFKQRMKKKHVWEQNNFFYQAKVRASSINWALLDALILA